MRDCHVWDVALSDAKVADMYQNGGVAPRIPAPIVSKYVSNC